MKLREENQRKEKENPQMRSSRKKEIKKKNERNKTSQAHSPFEREIKSYKDKRTIEYQNSQRFVRAQCIGQRFCSFIPDIIAY